MKHNGKQYTKQEAIRIITRAAQRYNVNLSGRRFLVVYDAGDTLGSAYISFGKAHFAHLTGLKINLRPAVFYDRCLDSRISQRDFDFTAHGNEMLKLSVLEQLPGFLWGPNLRGDFNRTGIYLSSDYFIGKTSGVLSVGFRHTATDDIPVSLMKEDIRKVTIRSDRVLAVWRSDPGSAACTELIFLASGQDEQELLKKL